VLNYNHRCAYKVIFAVKELIKAAKALSDETRLRILNLLLEREACVCEVMQALGISQTRASRNLKILSDAGFLKMRREGLWTNYSIDSDGLKDYQIRLIEAAKEALKDNKLAAIDKERLQEAERVGSSCAGKICTIGLSSEA
jgi:ArsR family transcriptional regulator